MRIAYIILAHSLPEQLVRLVSRLHTGSNSFFIHIDKKSDDSILAHVRKELENIPTVHFLERQVCHWAGFGLVSATISALRALSDSDVDAERVILLSGHDYPLRSNTQIARFLRKQDNISLIANFRLPHSKWRNGGLERFESWHARVFGRKVIFPANRQYNYQIYPRQRTVPLYLGFDYKRRIPENMIPFGGSALWCMTRDCAEYVVHFTRKNPKYIRFFRYVNVPDELFFQTIIMNSPFRDLVKNIGTSYMDWSKPKKTLCVEDFDTISIQ